jgi:hypothetical protein
MADLPHWSQSGVVPPHSKAPPPAAIKRPRQSRKVRDLIT